MCKQNANIREDLVQEIHKHVIDESGYLISLPDDIIKGIIKLVQSSDLAVETPWAWYDYKIYGPPDDDAAVLTYDGENKCIDRWQHGRSENLELACLVAEISAEEDDYPRDVTHWMYMPDNPKDE